jgi:peptidoglycan/xylan/chitin deacetylase (PgdA/CDA1 family)
VSFPVNWRTVAGSVLAPLARVLTGNAPRILFLHRVGENTPRASDPKTLALQLQYLKRHFTPLPLCAFVNAQLDGKPLPARAVTLTIDDGYADFGESVYPLLCHYEIPATLFVVSEFSAGSTWLWFDRLRYICEHSRRSWLSVEIHGMLQYYSLRNAMRREQSWDRLATRCLALSPTTREAVIEACARQGEVTIPANPPALYSALGSRQLQALDRALITIGAHTRTHPILSTCTEEEQWGEIAGCKKDLELALQRPIDYFCYPNGQPQDLTARTHELVQSAGYLAAVTSVNSFIYPGAQRYLLPRISVASDLAAFRNEINGLTELQNRIKGRGGRTSAGEIFGQSQGVLPP